MLKVEVKRELTASEGVFVFDSRNERAETTVAIMDKNAFAENITFDPKLTLADLAEMYDLTGTDPDSIEELFSMAAIYGKGAIEHLESGGTVWSCSNDYTMIFGIGACPYNSAYEFAVKFFPGDLRIFDSIDEFVSFDYDLAIQYVELMSDYYYCIDTEDVAANLTASTILLRDLIVNAAPKVEILSVANKICNNLIERVTREIPW